MSETNTQTSLPELNSVAERLRRAGFRQTGIARAVTELVWEYLGIHANMSNNLTKALWDSNTAVGDLLGTKETANDPKFEQLNTGTNN